MKSKLHLVLVHGFCLGGWCWHKLAAALESQGCRTTALDLVGSSLSDYIRPLMDFMNSLPNGERVMLVGHSYGGLPVSLAAQNFPAKISLAVFVTAYMPNCTDPPVTLVQEFFKRNPKEESFMDCKFSLDENGAPISAIYGPQYMAAKLYSRCLPEDLELAKMLMKPNIFFLDDLSKKSLLSKEKYGVVKRCYVICEEDLVLDEKFQRYNIEKSPPHEVISIAEAGHMPMLTHTNHLSSILLQLSRKYY